MTDERLGTMNGSPPTIAQWLDRALASGAPVSIVWRNGRPGFAFHFKGSAIRHVGPDAVVIHIGAKTTGVGPNERTEKAHDMVIPYHSILNLSVEED